MKVGYYATTTFILSDTFPDVVFTLGRAYQSEKALWYLHTVTLFSFVIESLSRGPIYHSDSLCQVVQEITCLDICVLAPVQ